ncbi:hypothetical protein E5671_01425 [Streptomyces sp. BA2]|nr:hypothetical protein [Streptomyces sp. BA2]
MLLAGGRAEPSSRPGAGRGGTSPVQLRPPSGRTAGLFTSSVRRRMPGLSQKMLSVTLRSLTRDGLVSRRVQPTVPPRVLYRLTGLGLSLEVALAGLRTWAGGGHGRGRPRQRSRRPRGR